MSDLTVERDPRVNPVEGDRLAKGDPLGKKMRQYRTVKRLPGSGPIHGGLGFRSSGRYSTIYPLNIAAWRKWAAGAEIVRRGDQ